MVSRLKIQFAAAVCVLMTSTCSLYLITRQPVAVALVDLALVWFMARVYVKDKKKKPETSTKKPRQEDEDVFNFIEAFMTKERPYLNEEYCIDKLAFDVKIPRNQVSRAINSYAGLNFSQYINRYRADYAYNLIVTERDMYFWQIGVASGFPSTTTFNTAFKKFKGKSPSQVREEAFKDIKNYKVKAGA